MSVDTRRSDMSRFFAGLFVADAAFAGVPRPVIEDVIAATLRKLDGFEWDAGTPEFCDLEQCEGERCEHWYPSGEMSRDGDDAPLLCERCANEQTGGAR
jgi:hypothetical protein